GSSGLAWERRRASTYRLRLVRIAEPERDVAVRAHPEIHACKWPRDRNPFEHLAREFRHHRLRENVIDVARAALYFVAALRDQLRERSVPGERRMMVARETLREPFELQFDD